MLDESLREFWKVVEPHHVRVFVGSEAVFPDLNVFDFSIGFDYLEAEGRHLRLHPSYIFENVFPDGWVSGAAEIGPPTGFSDRGFCDFIYSNSNALFTRDELFKKVNSFMAVAALGRHNPLIRRSLLPTRRAPGPVRPTELMEAKVALQKNFKFSITAENARYSGYTSEKILSSLIAGQIPIYHGNPRIADDFNPRRFINANELSTGELIDVLREIINSESRWSEIVSEPWYSGSQSRDVETSQTRLDDFLDNVFESASANKPKRGLGTFPEIATYRARRSRPTLFSALSLRAQSYLKKLRSRPIV